MADHGETVEEAVRREVREETGLSISGSTSASRRASALGEAGDGTSGPVVARRTHGK
jgi:8-oxo-dGTP pyrophosphatase MutT (NUDIX family)